MAAAAEDYARQGWRVLPIWWLEPGAGENEGRLLCGCGNPFCGGPDNKSAGKHPLVKAGRGMENASSDVGQVSSWWAAWPRANIAVATGAMSGIVVVDLDLHGDDDGEVELGAWAAGQGFEPPVTLSARTGGGGKHLVYQAPADGGPPIKNATGWLPGVDLRGEGGYILVAPSLHASGARYEWLVEGASGAPGAITGLGPLLGPLRSARTRASSGGGGGGEGRGFDEPPTYDYREACRAGPPLGTRDHFFNSRAFELRKQDVAYADAKAELLRVWELTPQPPGDAFAWETVLEKLNRVWGSVEPEPLPEWDALRVTALPPGASPTGKDTDLGNAQRFVELHGDEIRHTTQAGWFSWSGRHWSHDAKPIPVLQAAQVVESLFAEATRTADPVERDRLLRWAKASESRARVEAMASLARGLPPVAGSVLDFNPDPWLMNVGNGVLDLRTGKLADHEPGLMLSRLSEVKFDPAAVDTRWDRYLMSVTGGDEELVGYLRRAAGYTLTADIREEVFFIIYGPAASGKSTFLDALMTVLGDMAMLTQAETLMHQRGGQGAPLSELASMLDKRMVSTIEIPDGGRFAESLVKQMTGGDKISARHLYKDRFEFQPVFKLWIATNHAPRAYDDAIWRRIKRVPFPVTVPVEERDARLKIELKSPRSGLSRAVLAWAVQGCLEWQATGLGTCAAVERDTKDYEVEQDKFGRFLEDECIEDRARSEASRLLYDRYISWCDREGEWKMTHTAFGLKLRERGFEKNTSVRPVEWVGVALRERSPWGETL